MKAAMRSQSLFIKVFIRLERMPKIEQSCKSQSLFIKVFIRLEMFTVIV